METELTPTSTPTSPSSLFTHTPAPTTTTIPPAAVPATSGSKQKSRSAPSSTPTTRTSKSSTRGERITFELDDVLRKYSPEQFKTCKAYDVGGVNILNKKPVDSRTALDKLKRRRETHNRVERRRRDCINQLIEELTSLLPNDDDDSQSKCHRVNVLRAAVAHIQNLTQQNEDLSRQLGALQSNVPISPSYIGSSSSSSVPTVDYKAEGATQSEWADPNLPLSRTTIATSRSASPSLPSLSDISITLPSIPTIIEPSESTHPSSFSDPTSNNGVPGTCKRLNRQTLPRLQLVPPPFHHRRSNSGGIPSPSHYTQDTLTSPGSTYSGYSSASGPWSSSSSSLGPFSANSSSGPLSSYSGASPRSPRYPPFGPPSPHSPYGSSAGITPTSPSTHSLFHTSPYSPRHSDWTETEHRAVDGNDRGGDSNRDYGTSYTNYRSYGNDWQQEVGQETSLQH